MKSAVNWCCETREW